MLEDLRRELTRFVRAVTARFEHAVLYPATVRAQAGDGTLSVELDPGAPVPSLVGVPIRHGLPGVTSVSVAPGARVRVSFDGADPSRPFAVLWDAGNATAVRLNGGSHRAAREGHAVHGGSIQIATSSLLGPTVFTIQYVSAAGVPQGSPQTVTLGADGDPKVVALSAGIISEGASVLRLP